MTHLDYIVILEDIMDVFVAMSILLTLIDNTCAIMVHLQQQNSKLLLLIRY